jgi:hypothetical protein
MLTAERPATLLVLLATWARIAGTAVVRKSCNLFQKAADVSSWRWQDSPVVTVYKFSKFTNAHDDEERRFENDHSAACTLSIRQHRHQAIVQAIVQAFIRGRFDTLIWTRIFGRR